MGLIFYIICCFLVVYIEAEECHMPNEELGECIPLFSCPGLLRAFTNPFPGTEDYLRKFRCGADGSVCCGPPWDTVSDNRSLANSQYCGYQHSDDFSPSNIIFEFPWLAAIMAMDAKINRHDVLCHGALISDRYVITIARIKTIRPEIIITGVRLGEFHLKNKTDCINDRRNDDLEDCTKPVDYGIEKIIHHPLFEQMHNINNIALIKLNRTVDYSDYIRPICLPIPTLETTYAKPGDVLYITGWGFTKSVGQNGRLADVRKKISTKMIDHDGCRRITPDDSRKIITSDVICTLDLPNNTHFTCDGDGGAPLMLSYRNQWFLEGIVINIINHNCGTKYPVQSVKVSSYLEWIKQNTL